ncbi:hypothetical protein MHAS44199_14320 [Mycolicibacterium hassiacum DSM 44199]|nr:hypothetical protein [Mycolicibacterium hassiacum DSM 44199]
MSELMAGRWHDRAMSFDLVVRPTAEAALG